jgi:DNA-binding response OmpR family regulator
MTRKISENVCKSWPAEEGPRGVIEVNPGVEIEAISGAVTESTGTEADGNLLNASVLGEMLKLNEYQVVLISGTVLPKERQRTFSSFAPTVLLPFSWADLVAGVRELVRESGRPAERIVSQFADFCVDFIKMEVTKASGEVITLKRQEFRILKCFLSSPGRVLSRAELLNEAWGYECYPSTRTVDNHVSRLRRKFEIDPSRPIHFRTIHGVGYKFVPE